MPDNEIETEAEARAADRLNLFSDAVVAIAIGFGLSIPLFFVTTNAWVLWIVVPLLVSRWRHRHRRRRDRESGPTPGDKAPGARAPG